MLKPTQSWPKHWKNRVRPPRQPRSARAQRPLAALNLMRRMCRTARPLAKNNDPSRFCQCTAVQPVPYTASGKARLTAGTPSLPCCTDVDFEPTTCRSGKMATLARDCYIHEPPCNPHLPANAVVLRSLFPVAPSYLWGGRCARRSGQRTQGLRGQSARDIQLRLRQRQHLLSR